MGLSLAEVVALNELEAAGVPTMVAVVELQEVWVHQEELEEQKLAEEEELRVEKELPKMVGTRLPMAFLMLLAVEEVFLRSGAVEELVVEARN